VTYVFYSTDAYYIKKNLQSKLPHLQSEQK